MQIANSIKKIIHIKDLFELKYCILAADIGGTNSNFGIFQMKGTKLQLIISFHIKSALVSNYTELITYLINDCRKTYNIIFVHACIGAAGIVNEKRSFILPTNLSIPVDATDILKNNKDLEKCILINDFEAVGLGISQIDPSAIVTINKGGPQLHAQKACIGAGTGLGKAALLWNRHFKKYLPFTSEGGHADCAAQTALESELFAFIKKEKQQDCPISWEDVLSGYGIQRIYRFLSETKQYQETILKRTIKEAGFPPDSISTYAKQDQQCADTFSMYSTFYARCSKNFVLDTLALNGLYIAGGIAAKNLPIFQNPLFIKEFYSCGKHGEILKKVPVSIIIDYNVSLFGAAAFLQLHEQEII